ncbi:hypothetical protein M440DRAFT_207994 [Trichoderma longibrachiatum ATCC 18648]|uniref:Uncharacterized protein n=1 Tax=Trichoderma longibrachiatum ATCC 18648 TaxID=983965 RepID=A0A2T4BQV1_TRILO|nr:hypothetical protein M440DRAFT_207994 [Trichoderma longibrachiatum ATCC 18648]
MTSTTSHPQDLHHQEHPTNEAWKEEQAIAVEIPYVFSSVTGPEGGASASSRRETTPPSASSRRETTPPSASSRRERTPPSFSLPSYLRKTLPCTKAGNSLAGWLAGWLGPQ